MKVNLGCGEKIEDGWIGVDLKCPAQVQHNLNQFPWPFENDSVDEIKMIHCLEHLGEGIPEKRIKIIQELYRICKDGTIVKIVVPNPMHSDYLDDPTHCWPITLQTFTLFDKKFNRECIENGYSNSTLGLDYDVDFRILTKQSHPSGCATPFPSILGKAFSERHLINTVGAFEINLEVVKEK